MVLTFRIVIAILFIFIAGCKRISVNETKNIYAGKFELGRGIANIIYPGITDDNLVRNIGPLIEDIQKNKSDDRVFTRFYQGIHCYVTPSMDLPTISGRPIIEIVGVLNQGDSNVKYKKGRQIMFDFYEMYTKYKAKVTLNIKFGGNISTLFYLSDIKSVRPHLILGRHKKGNSEILGVRCGQLMYENGKLIRADFWIMD